MKRRIVILIAAAVMTFGLAACGGDDVKVLDKEATGAQTEAGSADDGAQAGDGAVEAGEEEVVLPGYVFEADGVSFTTDMDMADVLAQLGEPVQYYEAASCAFEGLDKVYTYQHFEVDTYPDGDKDFISSIIIKDDLVSTPEGLSIGMTVAEMEEIYGADYEVTEGMCVYTKDNMHLAILLSNGAVSSIQYNSSVLDSAN